MTEVISPAQRAAEIAHAKATLEFYGDNPEHKSLTDRHLFIPAFIEGFNAGVEYIVTEQNPPEEES